MNNKFKYFGLVLFGLITLIQTNLAQTKAFEESAISKPNPVFSSGLHTLSIHVKDSIVHDSVFHFLVEKLKLPIYYYPVGLNTKYAGVYAGNLVLEPCGPYIKGISINQC